MQLVGGDADLGAQPVLEAVGEAGRDVDHHARRIDLAQEARRGGVRIGDDRVGVMRAVALDVSDRLVERSDDLDADDRGQVFLAPVGLGRGDEVRAGHAIQQGERGRIAAHLDALLCEHRADRRQEPGRHVGMHEQRLGSVARAQLLRLGVVDDGQRHRQIGRRVDIDVAVAVEVLQHRYPGLARDALDQPLAAARNDEVDRFGRGDQQAHRGPVGGADELHRIGRQAGLGERIAHQRRQRQVRLQRLRAAAQDAGVAALDRQRRGLDRHVRPALVDHREHADRHPHAADPDAARLLAQAGDLADRIGHHRDLRAALRHGLYRCGVELQAVEHRHGETGAGAGVEVDPVRFDEAGRALSQPPRQRHERGVARRDGGGGQGPAGGAGLHAHVGNAGLKIGGGHLADCFRVGAARP